MEEKKEKHFKMTVGFRFPKEVSPSSRVKQCNQLAEAMEESALGWELLDEEIQEMKWDWADDDQYQAEFESHTNLDSELLCTKTETYLAEKKNQLAPHCVIRMSMFEVLVLHKDLT